MEYSAWILLLPLFCLLILALIGIYVYRDAKARKMRAACWTILAILVPCFIGLVIYLCARTGRSSLSCPQCGRPVEESFISCPSCGCRMKDTCPQCGGVIEEAWEVCPVCAEVLPEERRAAPPVRAKGRGGRTLVIILAAAILLFYSIYVVLYDTAMQGDAYDTAGCYTSEILEVPDLDSTVQAWTKECDAKGEGYYVLLVDKEDNEALQPVRDADEAVDDIWNADELWRYKNNYAYFIYYSGGEAHYAESFLETSNDFFPINYVQMQYDRKDVSPTGNPIFLGYSSKKKADPEKVIQINDTGEGREYSYAELKDKEIMWKK